MFSKGFGQTLAVTAPGNPAIIADPITWSARLIEAHPTWSNAAFASVQLFLALGIAWRPTVKLALAASVAWSLGVWWLGEGLGGVLNGTADPVTGAPGAVILYALLAVLLWPTDRAGPFEAARPFGAGPARLAWLALWGSFGYFAVQGANRAAQGLHSMMSGMAAGEPGWLATVDRDTASLLAGRGTGVSVVLAVVFAVIAVGIYLPAGAPAPPCCWRRPSPRRSGWSPRTSAAFWPGRPPTRTPAWSSCCWRPRTGRPGGVQLAFGRNSGKGVRAGALQPWVYQAATWG